MPLPGPRETIPHATVFRSTWIVSSHEGLRTCGYWERYLRALRDDRDQVVSCVAGAWLPIAVARSHYRACDSLGLSSHEVTAMGRGDGGRVRRTWYEPLVAAARYEASPWATLSQLHLIWRGAADGGAVAVFRTGDKEARIEYVGCELFDIPFFCQAVRTALLALAEHLGHEARVGIVSDAASHEAHYDLQWG